MNGMTHAAVGAAAGFGLSMYMGIEGSEVLLLTGACTVAALVPDLDTNGMLTNKLSLLPRLVASIALSAILTLILNLILIGGGESRWLYVIISFIVFALVSKVISKFAILFTALAIIGSGYMFGILWLTLFGVYALIAFFSPHRGVTHSLIGLAFFWYIAHLINIEYAIPGLSVALIVGYISHLVLDSKYLPGNVKGVKLLLPLRTQF